MRKKLFSYKLFETRYQYSLLTELYYFWNYFKQFDKFSVLSTTKIVLEMKASKVFVSDIPCLTEKKIATYLFNMYPVYESIMG